MLYFCSLCTLDKNIIDVGHNSFSCISLKVYAFSERFSERGNCTVVCNGSNLHDWITTVNKNLTNIDIRIRELDGNRPDHKYNNNEELRRINEKFVQIDAHLHVIDNQVQRVNGRVYEHDCWLEPLCKQVDCGCGCDCWRGYEYEYDDKFFSILLFFLFKKFTIWPFFAYEYTSHERINQPDLHLIV